MFNDWIAIPSGSRAHYLNAHIITCLDVSWRSCQRLDGFQWAKRHEITRFLFCHLCLFDVNEGLAYTVVRNVVEEKEEEREEEQEEFRAQT